ncbi:unnamed protein product [Parajaminaea phylloscopi]
MKGMTSVALAYDVRSSQHARVKQDNGPFRFLRLPRRLFFLALISPPDTELRVLSRVDLRSIGHALAHI